MVSSPLYRQGTLARMHEQFRTLLVQKPDDQYKDKNGNAYQHDLRIFCHQRIPEYLVQQLAEPSAEPLKYINFGSYQLTAVSKRRVGLPKRQSVQYHKPVYQPEPYS